MNFPGHNYLGPGNPILNGEPVDEDDRIAQVHDYAYEYASDSADIRSADRSAIGAFTKDFVTTGNYLSAIGAAGLGIKYLFESVAGVKYPGDLLSRKRVGGDTAEQSPEKGSVAAQGQSPDKGAMSGSRTSTEPPAKRMRNDDVQNDGAGGSGTPMDVAGSETEAKKHSMSSNANADGHGINVHHPISQFKKGKIMFTHSGLVWSRGYQFKTLSAGVRDATNTKQYIVTTPYAQVPCHLIPWYMTEQEFNSVPHNTSVKMCSTSVQPMGFRTPFMTNSAGLNSVNSNLFLIGMHAHGLNNTYHGINVSYTVNADKPCVPTGFQLVNKDDWEHWYGADSKKDTGLALGDIGCQFGNIHPLLEYYSQNYIGVENMCAFPELMKSIHIYNLENSMNNPRIAWQYKPQLCVIHSQLPLPAFMTNKTILHYGNKDYYTIN